MNPVIESFNLYAARLLDFAGPMLWQSSVLIVLLFALDYALRRKVRAGVRYLLWLLALVKLLLPPSLALPSGAGWWLRPPVPAVQIPRPVLVSASRVAVNPALPAPVQPAPANPGHARPSLAAWGVVSAGIVSVALLAWMMIRWRQVLRESRPSEATPEWLSALLEETRCGVGVRRAVGLRVVDLEISPAVCGWFRPVLLVPRTLVTELSPSQMRTVLLHELLHLRRGDVWVNGVQALLQAVYWWHPLLWVANARLRQVREEAVDDAVMAALEREAEVYAPTLLQVARLALARPRTSLGLVGILESHTALRQRIERLLDFRPPPTAGLTATSVLCVVAFGAVALPMGQASRPSALEDPSPITVPTKSASGGTGEVKKPAVASETAPTIQTNRPSKIVSTNAGRKAILALLDSIRFEQVQFENMRLEEVVRYLVEQSRKRDPLHQGVNFMLNANPLPGDEGARTDLAALPVQMGAPLFNLRLVDVLDVLVKIAPAPIKYSIEDYAVVISWRGNEAPPLYLRTYRVDPNTLRQGLEGVEGAKLPPGADASQINRRLRAFLEGQGVDLQAPKSIYYNDHNGSLLVRAALLDLDQIETAVQALNLAPTQVVIQTRFFAISEELAQSGTNRNTGWHWDANRLQDGSTVLSAAQAAKVRKELESTAGVELLSAGAVTTLSGRQAQIQAVSLQTIATNINPLALSPPGITNGPYGNGLFLTERMSFGPTFDVTASVTADTLNIQLSVLTSLTEFLGYDDPTNSVTAYVDGKQQAVYVPRPHFGVWQVNANAIVRDGRTLILGSPLDGLVARTGAGSTKKKWLLAMLTPTTIDAAGNRLHDDE